MLETECFEACLDDPDNPGSRFWLVWRSVAWESGAGARLAGCTGEARARGWPLGLGEGISMRLGSVPCEQEDSIPSSLSRTPGPRQRSTGREKAPGRGAEWTEGGAIIITDYQDGGWNEETTKQKGANSVGQQQLSGRVDAALPADRGRTDYNRARSEKE